MPFALQDLLVSLVAAAAALVFVRRFMGSMRAPGSRSCPSCASPPAEGGARTHPLVLMRPPRTATAAPPAETSRAGTENT
jgi:hypothetical protein